MPDSHRRKRVRLRGPKRKGCYECSQRRLNCDRKEPECGKCIAKGISCSGLGLRVRFCHGVAARGKLVGRSIFGEALPPASGLLRDTDVSCPTGAETTASLSQDAEPDVVEPELLDALMPSTLPLLPDDTLDYLSPWERSLINYFEEHIAPHMIAVDDETNGYRSLILPAAEIYPCVLKAVLASSAHHIALRVSPGQRPGALMRARTLYTDTIEALQQLCPDLETGHLNQAPNAMTALVMLICAMITGSSDFPILFRMLSASLAGLDLDEQLSLFHKFMNLQMRKFELYAKPFLSSPNNAPLQTTSDDDTTILQGLGCLMECSRLHPEHAPQLAQASQLIQIAGMLYSRRARNDLTTQTSRDLVNRFIATLAEYDPTQAGWNVLVWATFIVAAESRDPGPRRYLADALRMHYRRSGFGNLQAALRVLEAVWAADGAGENWTVVLPRWGVFIM